MVWNTLVSVNSQVSYYFDKGIGAVRTACSEATKKVCELVEAQKSFKSQYHLHLDPTLDPIGTIVWMRNIKPLDKIGIREDGLAIQPANPENGWKQNVNTFLKVQAVDIQDYVPGYLEDKVKMLSSAKDTTHKEKRVYPQAEKKSASFQDVQAEKPDSSPLDNGQLTQSFLALQSSLLLDQPVIKKPKNLDYSLSVQYEKLLEKKVKETIWTRDKINLLNLLVKTQDPTLVQFLKNQTHNFQTARREAQKAIFQA